MVDNRGMNGSPAWISAQVARATGRLEVVCRVARGENEAAVQAARERLAAYEARLRGGTDALPTAGLTLSGSETRILWTLVAAALDADARAFVRFFGQDDPDAYALSRLSETSAHVGLAELSPTAPLRRLWLIERSDGGGPDAHESRWTWAISRRVLAFLHGDLSIDPGVWITASQKLRLDLARR
jgi:hypothetical protein